MALITAMIVSVLLMITTSGMVSLTIKSLKQSTDGAQSTKAYYAAEGGLEEALLKLRRDPSYTGNCDGASAANSAKDGLVTCIKVGTQPNALVGELGPNQTVQLDLSSVVGLQSIKVEWTTDGFNEDSIPKYLTGNGVNQFPKQADWPSTAPAVLEVGTVSYPATAEFRIDQVGYHQGTIAPRSTKAGSAPATNALNSYVYNDASSLSRPFVVPCNTSGSYPCVAGVGLNQSLKYMLRLKARYNGAKYRITAQGANNVALAIPGATYTVDVTARAGDTFRRIQTSFPTAGSVPTGLPGLDYVLYSDTDICKSFEVVGTAKDMACPTP